MGPGEEDQARVGNRVFRTCITGTVHQMTTVDQHQSELTASSTGDNKLMKALLIAAITASALSMIFSVGTTIVSAQMSGNSAVVVDE